MRVPLLRYEESLALGDYQRLTWEYLPDQVSRVVYWEYRSTAIYWIHYSSYGMH